VSTFARALERDPAFTAVALGRALQAAGLPVAPDRSARFATAAALLGATDRDALYWAARLAFVSAQDEIPVFDAVFAEVVDGIADPAGGGRGDPNAAPPASRSPRATAPSPQRAPGGGGAGTSAGTGSGRAETRELPAGGSASDTERLADVRLEELDDAELELVGRLVRALSIGTPPRRPTGRAGRGSARRCGRSTTATAGAGWPATPWS
jgi:uncharacterized protein with von Willebrand factor type A (vWA) domain